LFMKRQLGLMKATSQWKLVDFHPKNGGTKVECYIESLPL